MLTITEKVTGVDVAKTLHKVQDLTGRTVTGPDGVAISQEYIVIGGVKLTGNTLIFLDAKDANAWGGNNANLVAAVSNNAFAAYANTTGSNATLILTSVNN